MDSPITISLCMIVKNEETCLRRCLDSVAGLVDEMVIVDTGSSDRTPDIAASYGAHLIKHAWADDFSAVRNISLERARSSWVLSLDADEEIDNESADRLRDTVARATADGLRLVVRNLMPAGELCRFSETRLTRLFRRDPRFRYEGAIHEQIAPSILHGGGRIVDADLLIIHYGYAQSTSQGDTARALRNFGLLTAALARAPSDAYVHYQLGITCKALGRSQAAADHLHKMLTLDTRGFDPEILENTHMKLAQLALQQSDYGAAVSEALVSLSYNPHNTIAHFVAAVSSMYRNEIRAAHDHFVSLKQSPTDQVANIADVDRMIAMCRKTLGISD